jgi:hypothetical protein
VRPEGHPSTLRPRVAIVAERIRASEIEPGSIMLFFLLLSVFIAILALRSRLLAPADSSPTVAAAVNPPAAIAAKSVSLRTAF